jgi:preprotein translocase subunit SecG
MFQKTEGGAALISSNVYNSFFSSKALTANPLTRITLILGVALFINCIVIGAIKINKENKESSELEKIQQIEKNKKDTKKTVKKSIPKGPVAPLGNK